MREVYQNTEEVESSSIIVYPNRRRMLGWTALSGIPALFFIPLIVGRLILLITTPDVRNQVEAIVFLILCMGCLFVMST